MARLEGVVWALGFWRELDKPMNLEQKTGYGFGPADG
jgi:hypothetical protein